jgi:hypothetical protein
MKWNLKSLFRGQDAFGAGNRHYNTFIAKVHQAINSKDMPQELWPELRTAAQVRATDTSSDIQTLNSLFNDLIKFALAGAGLPVIFSKWLELPHPAWLLVPLSLFVGAICFSLAALRPSVIDPNKWRREIDLDDKPLDYRIRLYLEAEHQAAVKLFSYDRRLRQIRAPLTLLVLGLIAILLLIAGSSFTVSGP